MAQVISISAVKNAGEQTVLDTLATNLPDDYVIVPNVQVGNVPEIDFVIIRKDVIITVEVKGWYNTIKGEPFAGSVQVGPKSCPNPVLQAQKQMQELVRFLKHRKQARLIFDDPRVANTIYVRPVVIFSNPKADIQLPSTDRVLVLSLTEAAEKLRDPNLKRYPCNLTPVERERLANLLLNRLPSPPAPEPKGVIVAETPPSAQTPQTAPEPTAEQPHLSRFVSRAHPSSTDTIPDTVPDDNRSGRTTPVSLPGLLMSRTLGIIDKVEQITDFENLRASKKNRVNHRKLAKSLETELEDGLYYLLDEVLACNRFTIYLSSRNFHENKIIAREGEQKLTDHIGSIIRARNYQTKGTVKVEFAEDGKLEPGDHKITSTVDETVKPPKAKEEPPAKIESKLQGPYLEYIPGGEKFPLEQKNITLGRSKQNVICVGHLDSMSIVSRKHIRIHAEEDGWIVYDGGDGKPSMRGTYVNGEKLRFGDGCLLRDGHRIILGPPQRANPFTPLQGSMLLIFHENQQ